MINTIIAYDDNDFTLGEYFKNSHQDIYSSIVLNELINNVSIRGLDCTEDSINAILSTLDGNRFVFIALSHGNYYEFVCSDAYISIANAHHFANSFLYSTACSTGKHLGEILLANGCHSFIGYTEEIEIVISYSSTFYYCENFGIKSFLGNDETIEVSFFKMVENYNFQIDSLIAGSLDDLIAATYLISNRDYLVLLGNRTLTRKDFN